MRYACSKHGQIQSGHRQCATCIDEHMQCSAVGCRAKIPARHFMCSKHWAMVPDAEQERLGELFQPDQYYTMTVTRAWNRQAMRCKLLVAEREGISVDLIQTYKYRTEG